MIRLVNFHREERVARFENDKGQTFDVSFEEWQQIVKQYDYFKVAANA